jgi:CheY-like chemotaxis protein/anti-sigma regulatory factor (Ser/Thr protein kinase)
LQTEVDDDAPLVLADEARLQQILGNLLSNACKYTPAGGWITVRANAVGGQVAISVSDTGYGIPADALPRVFSKFYRVDQATTAEIGGTGLGLAITKALVEMHGGRITIASKHGAGTTVRFTLPTVDGVNDDESLTAAGFRADEPWAGARPAHGRVLLAEDDPEAALLTQRQLSARGLEVTVVPDGLAALVRAIEWLPDAILLDVNMPKMGAGEVLPQLRGNPGTRDIPIIILTGTVPDARAYFMEAGAVDFFTKPVDIDALAARLSQLLSARRGAMAGVELDTDGGGT